MNDHDHNPTKVDWGPYLLRLTENIEKFGHAIQGVFGEVDDTGHTVAFSYTVGLTERPQPELFIDRLGPQQGGHILNSMANYLEGKQPEDGAEVDLEYSVLFRLHGPIDVDEAEITMPGHLYGREAVTAFQVLWPDPGGRFPGDLGYDSENFPQRRITKV